MNIFTWKWRRRNFVVTSLAAAATTLGGIAVKRYQQASSLQLPQQPTMPERVLGGTGVKVPILGLGGAGQTPLSWQDREADAIALIERALQLGIRYFDTAAEYGPSEDYLGKVLPQFRSQLFIASKTSERSRDGAWRNLERSLQRLNTDRLDLWQMHRVSFPEELEQIFAANGAIKAIEEAKAQKIIRFAGITGHREPDAIVQGLQRYAFDTALICINAADKHHPRPFMSAVLPVAIAKNVGVIAMKVPAYGKLLQPGILDGMHQAMGYALSQAGVHCCIIAAETAAQLEANVQVAQAFKPLAAKELAAIEQRVAAFWEENTFFRVWS